MIQPNNFNWPGKVWICSDLHLGDTGILKYERTQFKNSDEHDDFIIKRINLTINKDDTFVCLGDLGKYWENTITKIKNCKRKVLILGNHDRENKGKYRKYFNEVYDGPLFVNKFTVISHEPIPVSEHFINIHGHLHNANLDNDHYVNVSIAMNNYNLYPLDKTIDKAANYPRIKAEFLEEWYADKYVFTDGRKDVMLYSDTLHIVPKDIRERILERSRRQIEATGELDQFNKFLEEIGNTDMRILEFLSSDSEEKMSSRILMKYWVWRSDKNAKELLERTWKKNTAN